MSEFDNTPVTPPSSSATPGPAGWVKVWIKAVSQPNEQAYVDISESPEAQPKTAYIWIFIAGTFSALVGGVLQVVVTAISGGLNGQTDGQGVVAVLGGSLVGVVCISPLAGGLSVLFFALGAAIIQWIAKLFGGTGTYDKLVYTIAAISVPFTLVSTLLVPFNSIPFLNICTGLLSVGLGFYALYLQIIAVKAVNRFGWGEAAGSVLIPGFVFLLVCGCVVGIGIAVMGTAFASVFNQGFAP